MKTLLLDVDGVCADCASAIHSFTEFAYERELPHPHDWNSDFPEAFGFTKPRDVAEFYSLCKHSFNPHSIELYPGAGDLIKVLKRHFEVVFVTAEWKGMERWVVARERLLAPLDCELIFTHSKHRVLGDLLVDDKASTISKGGPWKGLLFTRPWNASLLGFERVGSLEEVLRYA